MEHAKLIETKKGDEKESDIVIAERFIDLGSAKMSVENNGIREGFIKFVKIILVSNNNLGYRRKSIMHLI